MSEQTSTAAAATAADVMRPPPPPALEGTTNIRIYGTPARRSRKCQARQPGQELR